MLEINQNFVVSVDQSFANKEIPRSHKITRGYINNDKSTPWYRKEMASPKKAKIEALSQEYFRVLIPEQPETLLAKDSKTGVHYILSKEIPGFSPLRASFASDYLQGRAVGLGQLMAVALVIEEVDFKNGNFGQNNTGRILKIDGELCCAELQKELADKTFDITPEVISQLPYLQGVYAYNWFDSIVQGVVQADSKLLNPALQTSSYFKAELYQGFLKICLMPTRFITGLVEAYLPDDSKRFIDFMLARRDQLCGALMQDPGFLQYLEDEKQVSMDHCSLMVQMQRMKVDQTIRVVAKEKHEKLIVQCTSRLTELKSFKSDCKEVERLLGSIYHERLSDEDQIMNDFITRKREELVPIKKEYDKAKLSTLKFSLKATLDQLASKELRDVKEEIDRQRKTKTAFTVGKEKKATEIENALYALPIEARGIVLTGPFNPVQAAMGKKRTVSVLGLFRSNSDPNIILPTSHEPESPKATNNFTLMRARALTRQASSDAILPDSSSSDTEKCVKKT